MIRLFWLPAIKSDVLWAFDWQLRKFLCCFGSNGTSGYKHFVMAWRRTSTKRLLTWLIVCSCQLKNSYKNFGIDGGLIIVIYGLLLSWLFLDTLFYYFFFLLRKDFLFYFFFKLGCYWIGDLVSKRVGSNSGCCIYTRFESYVWLKLNSTTNPKTAVTIDLKNNRWRWPLQRRLNLNMYLQIHL